LTLLTALRDTDQLLGTHVGHVRLTLRHLLTHSSRVLALATVPKNYWPGKKGLVEPVDQAISLKAV